MLVLSRRRGQNVVIDGHIVVRVIEIKGDKVRLGFEAPRDVRVNREEIERNLGEGDRDRRDTEGDDVR